MIKNNACIVTNDIFGMPYDSEISLFYSELAILLTSMGYAVTVLLIIDNISQYYEKLKAIDSFLVQNSIKLFYIKHENDDDKIIFGLRNENLIYSFKTYKWLISQSDFNIIHFHDFNGIGFYSLLAKHQGLAFQNSTIYVKTFYPTRWKLSANMSNFDSINYITTDYIERKSIELCDVLLSPSQYMINWLKDNSWKMPNKTFILPNIINDKKSENNNQIIYNNYNNSIQNYNRPIKELVYYGNFEKQKGLDYFLDAVDILTDTLNEKDGLLVNNLTISFIFIGDIDENSLNNVRNRSAKWNEKCNCRTNLIDNFDFEQSIGYLRNGGTLVVLPYLLDNNPYIISICQHFGISFLVSNKIAFTDSADAVDFSNCTFFLKPDVLAEKIKNCLVKRIKPVKSVLKTEIVKQNWIKLFDETINIKSNSPIGLSKKPKVSVCLIHHERPHLLKYAIDSLRKQDYSNFEVILVDDGSRDRKSHEYLDSLSEEFNEKSWKIIKQDNLFPGAARNRAAREAGGEYILFMDDDDYAKPYEISTFIKAAINSNADVLTCFMEIFNNESEPNEIDVIQLWIFTGDAAASIFVNSFGPANALFKKDVFFKLGGFTDIKGIGHEDWELFAKAVLKGYRFEVIPEPLFYYRKIQNNITNMTNSTIMYYNHQRSLKPYIDELGIDISPAILYLNNTVILNNQISYLKNYISALKQNLKDKFNIVINDI
jgi:glycosyltransferase involved in cell wall biosynthesis